MEGATHSRLARPDSAQASIAECFEVVVARAGSRTALRTEHAHLTYDELNTLANRIALAISAGRCTEPPIAALALDHGVHAVAATMGAAKAGAAWVHLSPRHPLDRNARILGDAGAPLLVTDRQNLAQARSLAASVAQSVEAILVEDLPPAPSQSPAARPPSEAPALLKYTSGSTGKPKGVCLPSRAILHTAMIYGASPDLAEGTRVAVLSPLLGTMDLYGPLLHGATICLFDVQRDGIERLAEWIDREAISWLQCVPTVFRRLAQGAPPRHRFESLRLLRLYGEPVTQSEWQLFRAHLAPHAFLHVGFGSTEALSLRSSLFAWHDNPTAPVLPLLDRVAGKELLLLAEDGAPVAPGEVGEISVRSEFIFTGYWRQPELTAAVLAPDPTDPKLRIFRTGDLARQTSNGELVHVGRSDRQVKVSGTRIEIAEVETALRRIAGIRDAAVVRCARGPGATRLVAFCVADAEARSRAVLSARLHDVLPAQMTPATFLFPDALPTLPGGKIDYATLEARIDSALSAPAPPRNPIEETLVEIWKRALGSEQVGVHDDLFLDLGGDSLAAVQILNEVMEVYGRELPLAVFHDAPTIGELAGRLALSGWQLPGDGRLIVNREGALPPVFALCGAYGHALRLLLVGRALGPEQPFVGLQPPAMDWEQAGCRSIEEMAAHYAGEIRSMRPHGPYRLFGTSLGGILAFEIASLLQRAGEPVHLLAMVDTSLPTCMGPSGIERVAPRDFVPAEAPTDRLVAMGVRVARQHQVALDAYVLRSRFDGRILYFKCLEPAVPASTDRRRLWERYATHGLRMVPVPGIHGQFHMEPQRSAIVRGLLAALERGSDGPPPRR
jgi:amino acid adenylation domain-containing protein